MMIMMIDGEMIGGAGRAVQGPVPLLKAAGCGGAGPNQARRGPRAVAAPDGQVDSAPVV